MGQSLFNVGRKLTPEEWGELKAWRAANPELRWKRGDVRADGLVYWDGGAQYTNGERWVEDRRAEAYASSARQCERARYAADPEPAKSKRRRLAKKHRAVESARHKAWRNGTGREKYQAWVRANYDKLRADPTHVQLTRLRSREKLSGLRTSRAASQAAVQFLLWQARRLGWSEGEIPFHIDHVVPIAVAKGRPDLEDHVTHWSNLVLVPPAWNSAKRDALPSYGYLRYRDSLVEEYLKALA